MDISSFTMNHQLLSLPIFISFVVFVFVLRKVLIKSLSSLRIEVSKLPLPPGPRKLPFIGNLHHMVCTFPHHRLRDLAKTYGPLMHLQLGEIPTIVVSSPEIAVEVMKTHDINFANRPYFLTSKFLFYDSKDIALAPYGDYWRQMRKIVTIELLSNKRVKQMEFLRDDEVSTFIRTISLNARSIINLSEMLAVLSYDIITKATFGVVSDKNRTFMRLQNEITEIFGSVNLADMFPSVKLFQLTSRMRPRLERLHLEVDKLLTNIIDECQTRKAKEDTLDSTTEGVGVNFLDTFLHLKEHGEFKYPLTMDHIKAVILDIFLAGIETSSTVVEWAMSELIRNPRKIQKAQAEVRELFDKKEGKIEEADIEQIKFLKLVVKETMRLHPPLPLLLPRISKEKCEIKGYGIGANTQVMINAWAIGRDPKSWIEPENFYPERFVDSSVDFKGNHFEFIPFGAGRRICPGISFGIANVEIILANLLYHFDWLLPDNKKPEDLDMTEGFGASISKKYPLWLIPIPYKRPLLM